MRRFLLLLLCVGSCYLASTTYSYTNYYTLSDQPTIFQRFSHYLFYSLYLSTPDVAPRNNEIIQLRISAKSLTNIETYLFQILAINDTKYGKSIYIQ